MSKSLSSFPLPWTLWKRANNFRHISFSKGMILFADVTQVGNATDVDVLYENLKIASSSTTILKLIKENHQKMNTKHVVQALRSIFSLHKEGKINLPLTKSLLKHPEFEKLCNNLKSHAGVLEVSEIIEALKVISYLGIPSTSTITQVLLQLVRQNINSLNIQQILYIDFVIQNFKHNTPLEEALKIALPLVFEINIPKKMDRRNPLLMADCLHFAIRSNLNQETIDLILSSLETFPAEFHLAAAKSIIWSLCSLPKDNKIEPLYSKCVTDLIVNFDTLSEKDMEITVHKMAHQYTRTYPFYYQEVFFDTCANHVVENKLHFNKAVGVLRQLARVDHFHKNLLDYISTLIFENKRIQCDPVQCYSLVVSLVLCDYKPVYWENLMDWIRKAKDLAAENKKEIIWIRFAAALCLLGVYKADVLSRALNYSYLNHLFKKGFMSDFENYFTIWKSITIYKPDLIDLLPSNLEPKKLISKLRGPSNFPLEAELESGLGGKQYLLTCVHSKLGDIIDHVVVFKKGYPLPLDNSIKFIEDLALDNDCQIVLILNLQHFNFTLNTKMLRLSKVKTINILEQNIPNCHVVPINLESWQELEEFERIPYLMQKIKDKIDVDIAILQNVI